MDSSSVSSDKSGKPGRQPPNIHESSKKVKDPVRTRKEKDEKEQKQVKKPPPPAGPSIPVLPSFGTRINLHYRPDLQDQMRKPGDPLVKYVPPKTKQQIEEAEAHRREYEERKKACEIDLIELADAQVAGTLDVEIEISSPEVSKAKVVPKKPSYQPSDIYPQPPTEAELEEEKPKSGIFINETEEGGTDDYDSFDLVYTRQPRPEGKDQKGKKQVTKKKVVKRVVKKGEGDGKQKTTKKDVTASKEADEDAGSGERRGSGSKRKKKGKGDDQGDADDLADILEKAEKEEEAMARAGEGGEGEEGKDEEPKAFKVLRRKVSQASAATSYQSRDLRSDLGEDADEQAEPISRLIQKYRRDSEMKEAQKAKRKKLKRGTLESHSFTKFKQPTLKEFYFGSKAGTMHQGDDNVLASIRNLQGICMPVAAYCYSMLLHPSKWTDKHIDAIIEVGNRLYTESAAEVHMHEHKRELQPEELQKYCFIDTKKVRFSVNGPEVTGMLRSDERRVFNVTKGLKIFFSRHKAGLFKAGGMNLAIWKDKYFYFFDACPRKVDLSPDPEGFAVMAHFYDIPALVTILLERCDLGNAPFAIYVLEAYKIYNALDTIESETGLEARSNFNILDDQKAVVVGSFDLADKCFDFTRKKQALPMSVVALVYSRITPPSAWQRRTIDKILTIGNQLYLECVENQNNVDIKLDNLPAVFTIGPYVIEIVIYAKAATDLMVKKNKSQFGECLENFFKRNTNAIIQLGGKYTIAVWKQRNMFYCFDPYSNNNEGLKCRDGAACVSMHTTLASLLKLITRNFDDPKAIFVIHSLKVIKIHRDPAQNALFPKHLAMNDYPVESFKKYKMVKPRTASTGKKVTVDYQDICMKELEYGQSPASSLYEIGSAVQSLTMDEIPAMKRKFPSKMALKQALPATQEIADLDSPSLSDTQIAPPRPQPDPFLEGPDAMSFLDKDSMELTQEELDMQRGEGEGGGQEGSDDGRGSEEGQGDRDMKTIEKEMEQMAGEGGEGEDWYMAAQDFTQVGSQSLGIQPSKQSIEINTDITYFPIPKEVLRPTNLKDKQHMKEKKKDSFIEDQEPEAKVTQSEELQKDSNFVELPDNSEIVRGTKNMAELGDDLEFMAPFVCIMAATVAKKYAILTWSSEIVDYVLRCGAELYKASKVRYDQVSKLEIPKIALGKTNYSVQVSYLFDSYMKQNIVELVVDKVLFSRFELGILVTPAYACAMFAKNGLYYLYDGFGNNEVGLSEGPTDKKGKACFCRFKNVHAMVERLMYNKVKREGSEKFEYTRFVVSSVKVSTIRDEVAPKKKRKKKGDKKKDKKKQMEEEHDQLATQGEGNEEFIPEVEPEEAEEEEEEEGEEEPEEEEEKKEPENKVGYQREKKGKVYILAGSKGLSGRGKVADCLKEDHFVCICACLMLTCKPVAKWDTKTVDKVLDKGKEIYGEADDLDFAEKRSIKNILIKENYFDIIVKRIKIAKFEDNENIRVGIDTLMRKKHNVFLIQFTNACYAFHKSDDRYLHLFDPYGSTKKGKPQKSGGKAGWIRFKSMKKMKRRIMRSVKKGAEGYQFYTFEVTNLKKAPKGAILEDKLQEYQMDRKKKQEIIDKPFYEEIGWLDADPVPWSRRTNKTPSGGPRGKDAETWHDWEVEYARDLYSMQGSIHQNSKDFPPETRGKQTLANLVVAIAMMEIYELQEWNSYVIDSILVNGDAYITECVKDISDEDYELSMDDLIEDCSIFPYSFKVTTTPVVQGTMFITRVKQFNLYKALRYFFDNYESRHGIVIATRNEKKRQVAFGKNRPSEYYMFDCEAFGPPMFVDRRGNAYVMRMTTLNRLLHVLTLTLRGGDFYIYEVEITDIQPVEG